MDKKKLMRKKKAELEEMLKARKLKADAKAKKNDMAELILAHERKVKTKARKRKPPKKVSKKARADREKQRMQPEPEAVRAAQEEVGAAKFSTEAAYREPPSGEIPARETPRYRETDVSTYPTELPKAYGEDRITAMVRDPYWMFAYWEVTPESSKRARSELGEEAEGSRTTIRVYDISGIDFTGQNAHSHFDIEVTGGADNWYINTGWPNRSYCVDIGLLGPRGSYRTIARSNAVHMPRATMSEEVDERWMSLEEEFERIYALSGGLQLGEGSLGLREMMEKQLEMHLASEAVGSLFSMAVPEKERGFRFVLDTELIVYGATEPDATVTMQGRPLKLRPDGTFSVRFALPDGKQVVPVTARSADGLEERTITPTVTRKTTAQEAVLQH